MSESRGWFSQEFKGELCQDLTSTSKTIREVAAAVANLRKFGKITTRARPVITSNFGGRAIRATAQYALAADGRSRTTTTQATQRSPCGYANVVGMPQQSNNALAHST